MDIAMPGRNGIEATREIASNRWASGVLILTMFADDESIFAAMRAGARGYLLKDASHDEMRRAIESVGGGEAIFGAGVAQRMVGFFARARELGVQPFPELTDREQEVLEELAKGPTTRRSRTDWHQPEDRPEPRQFDPGKADGRRPG